MHRLTISLSTLVFLISLLFPGMAAAQTSTPPVIGIDHIPVVVTNLEQAEADYRRLGFSIKPGRPHTSGIRNAHVKFPDGTEIELITAPAALDALTTEYQAKMKSGDGPVYFGLYAPDRTTLTTKLLASGFPVQNNEGILTFPSSSLLHPLFFGSRNKSPTDKPEYFAHANSAARLSALWVRGNQELRALLGGLGKPSTVDPPCTPFSAPGENSVTLPEGHVYLVPSVSANVVAARVEVRSLAILESVLRSNHVAITKTRCDAGAIWISPTTAHGIWLQFIALER